MKVAIIGDSTVGCLKLAAANMNNDIDFDFFAAPSTGIGGLNVGSHELIAGNERLLNDLRFTSGKENPAITPAKYDAIVLSGMGIDIRPLFTHYSNTVCRAACADIVAYSLCLKTLRKIQLLADTPIWILGAPLKALSKKRFTELYNKPLFSYVAQSGTVANLFKEMGAHFVAQPAQTRWDDWRTKPRFSVGSTRLIQGTPHPHRDNMHMNAEYGKILLQTLISRLKTRPISS